MTQEQIRTTMFYSLNAASFAFTVAFLLLKIATLFIFWKSFRDRWPLDSLFWALIVSVLSLALFLPNLILHIVVASKQPLPFATLMSLTLIQTSASLISGLMMLFLFSSNASIILGSNENTPRFFELLSKLYPYSKLFGITWIVSILASQLTDVIRIWL